ncbi:amidohydrolase family protein [Moheibacter sediminis]|uniref:Imidazolonepropionase n=1 Tax=Moheibacter sediminis TaxID=1434700 RepID=A0A1W2C691_9FLAO|nr:amidohydrolase family protein [Moheibacter sediminis]SMC80392.1 Imidazolonepropionase [Moheibacter sediminis]
MIRNFLFTIILISLFLVIPFSVCAQKKSDQSVEIAITNVNIIPMTINNHVIYNATVLIKDNYIQSINNEIPDGVKIINAKGKWLIPGLIDMHVHLPSDVNTKPKFPTEAPDIVFEVQDIMTLFVTNGVTTIFNLNANLESFSQRKEIQKGCVLGPRIAVAALIDGGEGNGRRANTPEQGRQTVRIAKAEGFEFIKLYSKLNIETYKAIIDEANKQGLKTVGHIPNVFQNDLKGAFVPHFDMVAHAEEFSKSAKDFNYAEALSFAKIAKENGTWVTPTLTAMEWIADQTNSLERLESLTTLAYVHPLLQSKWLTSNSYNKNSTPETIAYFKKLVEFQKLLVKAFKESGVPVTAGTDAGVSGVVSGFSLHDELVLLVEAGMTPEEALVSATRLPAIWLGLDSKIGTVEVGKLADLILLDENPLDKIKNISKISGVIVNGQLIEKDKINEMLSELATKNNTLKPDFDWKKMMSN